MLRKFWKIIRNQLTILCQIVANLSKLYFCLIDIKLYQIKSFSRVDFKCNDNSPRALSTHAHSAYSAIASVVALQLMAVAAAAAAVALQGRLLRRHHRRAKAGVASRHHVGIAAAAGAVPVSFAIS
jgi:hypothetical protein